MIDLGRWISVVAAAGMLTHALAVVRHNGMALSALLELPKLTADLARICHGGEAAGARGGSETPANDAKSCPICSGLGPTCLAAASARTCLSPSLAAARAAMPATRPAPPPRLALRPPARAPPLA
jgi:hypothetical protein